jgi:hypothetical protein
MAEEFRTGIGGPLHRVERAVRLEKLRRLIPATIAVTWVPLLAFALVEELVTQRREPMLLDLSVHVRLLITLPLLLVADRLLDLSCDTAVTRLFGEGFVPVEQHNRVRAVLRRAERLRDAALPELIILAVALAVGLASLLGVIPAAGLVHGVVEARYSAARIWYALVALPIFQFVLWRSLFRWTLWVRVLFGLSRVPLRLLPAHADRRGGIAFLKVPSIAYGATLLLAAGCALSGGWETQILLYGTKIDAIKPLFVSFVLIGSVIAIGPLLAFVPRLFDARRLGRIAYGALMSDYARQFQERWIKSAPRAELLGNADMQSLADLSSAYRENVDGMQLVLFQIRDCIVLLVMALIPAVPILLSQVPAREVLKRLLQLATGGMPG